MSQMIGVKTAELIGAALNYATALANGWDFSRQFYQVMFRGYCPSTDWAQGGPLIEKYGIGLLSPKQSPCDCWHASTLHPDFTDYTHPTNPLIAACRAIVAAKLGDVVSVPAELALPTATI